MNYAEIKEYDIANGPGVRLSLFVSGCTHRCRGCFNEMTWDFNYGRPFTQAVQDELLTLLEDVSCRGLTLLGGEPMEPANQRALLPFLRAVKERFPKKDIWCFTGYLLDRDLLCWNPGCPPAMSAGQTNHGSAAAPDDSVLSANAPIASSASADTSPADPALARSVREAVLLASGQRLPGTSVCISETRELLSMIDVLVDGEYMEEKKDITLLYKGSANQRTIDVQKTLKAGWIVQWDPGDVSMSKTAHL